MAAPRRTSPAPVKALLAAMGEGGRARARAIEDAEVRLQRDRELTEKEAARLARGVVEARLADGDAARALETASRWVRRTKSGDEAAQLDALAGGFDAAVAAGDLRAAVRFATRRVEVLRAMGKRVARETVASAVSVVWPLWLALEAPQRAFDAARAWVEAEDAVPDAPRRVEALAAVARVCEAIARARSGWDELWQWECAARAFADEAVRAFEHAGAADVKRFAAERAVEALHVTAAVQSLRGEHDRAREALARAAAIATDAGAPALALRARQSAALGSAAAGDWEACVAELPALESSPDDESVDAVRIRALLAAGRVDEASASAAAWLERVRATSDVAPFADVLMVAAVADHARVLEATGETRDAREGEVLRRARALVARTERGGDSHDPRARVVALAYLALAEHDAGFATMAKSHVDRALRASRSVDLDPEIAALVGYVHESVVPSRARAKPRSEAPSITAGRAVAALDRGDRIAAQTHLIAIDLDELANEPAALAHVLAVSSRLLREIAPADVALVDGEAAWSDLRAYVILPTARPRSHDATGQIGR